MRVKQSINLNYLIQNTNLNLGGNDLERLLPRLSFLIVILHLDECCLKGIKLLELLLVNDDVVVVVTFVVMVLVLVLVHSAADEDDDDDG